MSDLPSPEALEYELASGPPGPLAMRVLAAFSDGRLVDREAIVPLVDAVQAVIAALDSSDLWGLGVVDDLRQAVAALGGE